jgi:hypothetical protein
LFCDMCVNYFSKSAWHWKLMMLLLLNVFSVTEFNVYFISFKSEVRVRSQIFNFCYCAPFYLRSILCMCLKILFILGRLQVFVLAKFATLITILTLGNIKSVMMPNFIL